MAGTPGSGFLSSRAWKAAAIWISLPLISGLAKAIFRSLSMLGRSRERGPLEDRAGVEVLRRRHRRHLDDAALLVGAHRCGPRRASRWPRRPCRETTTAPTPAQLDARSGDRAGDVGIDEGHFGGMDRAGDGFLDIGIPARGRRFEPGNQAGHVLVGGDGREADPDAEADDERRQEGTFFLTGGGRQAASKRRRCTETLQDATEPHWRATMMH